MSLNITQNAKTIPVGGFFNIDSVLGIKPKVMETLDAGQSVILDFSTCAEIDSYALGFLVSTRKHAETLNLDLILMSPTQPVLALLDTTRLRKNFNILGA